MKDGGWNAWIGNMQSANEMLGFLHGAYGAGATIAPLIATSMITKGNLQWYTFYYLMVPPLSFSLFPSNFLLFPGRYQVSDSSLASNNTIAWIGRCRSHYLYCNIQRRKRVKVSSSKPHHALCNWSFSNKRVSSESYNLDMCHFSSVLCRS